jgi:hypothetical protein
LTCSASFLSFVVARIDVISFHARRLRASRLTGLNRCLVELVQQPPWAAQAAGPANSPKRNTLTRRDPHADSPMSLTCRPDSLLRLSWLVRTLRYGSGSVVWVRW